ncbi:MAG: hypothetical protein AMXMBFR34_27400 [Myxococcaceae bacterium]
MKACITHSAPGQPTSTKRRTTGITIVAGSIAPKTRPDATPTRRDDIGALSEAWVTPPHLPENSRALITQTLRAHDFFLSSSASAGKCCVVFVGFGP